MTAILTYELNGIALNMQADKSNEFEDLVLWVVNDKPHIPEIASRLEELTDKYQANSVAKFISKLKKMIEPFSA